MNIDLLIREEVAKALSTLYGEPFDADKIQTQMTRKEFEGDLTVVVFPFTRISKKGPEQTANDIGSYLTENVSEINRFNVVKGFLNLVISSAYWTTILDGAASNEDYGYELTDENSPLYMVEYSSPNTNKPLHLGHIRNNLLGYSISSILNANGKKVVKTNIVNDRGIHICKSMYAWMQSGKNETPDSTGKKGDHLVGDYYVQFDQLYKKEVAGLVAGGMDQKEAEAEAPSMKGAREMLLKWEANDPEIRSLWAKMNQWVYTGFDVTYKNLGVDFDKIYYESDTYTVGRDEVLRGLKEGIFERHDDGSVWANLEAEGLDQKILLRSDGTSVYMTQDIGTAKLRYEDYNIDKMVYVVGNEQNYHFQVLSILLDKLGFEWGSSLYHFSYGMVELPQGKMKSREGTVVDADDLMAGMIDVARKTSEELGKLDEYDETEKQEIYRKIAMGALKYFILKVDPKKTMLFNPEESIDFNGNTGPFIQYTYARIQSVLRKAVDEGIEWKNSQYEIEPEQKELELIKKISNFSDVVSEAASNFSPAIIANYCYDLVKEFNQFYHDYSIMKESDEAKRCFRLKLAETTAKVIRNGMGLLGIECPERM
ncbi:arginine--tRNA ligase [Roseimarinus sediminis]|uniref:arginine--tRNA ligase n=1 Tax=Roseimarinus sediminis TaxID=1610899 RepID=UPI003D1F07AA